MALPCYNSTWKVGGKVNVIFTSVISRLLYMKTVNTFHLEYLCTLEGKWESTTGQLYCLELAQSYYLPGLRNQRRISWVDLFIFFPHAVPFPFTFGWTRSNPNVPFLPRWPNNPTLDIQPEPFSSFANFITAF